MRDKKNDRQSYKIISTVKGIIRPQDQKRKVWRHQKSNQKIRRRADDTMAKRKKRQWSSKHCTV